MRFVDTATQSMVGTGMPIASSSNYSPSGTKGNQIKSTLEEENSMTDEDLESLLYHRDNNHAVPSSARERINVSNVEEHFNSYVVMGSQSQVNLRVAKNKEYQ